MIAVGLTHDRIVIVCQHGLSDNVMPFGAFIVEIIIFKPLFDVLKLLISINYI